MARTVTAVTYARKIIVIPLFLYLSYWPLLSSQMALSDSGDDFGFKSAERAFACRFCSFYDASAADG